MHPMNIYHVSQTFNGGWDTYSDFVVCAESEDVARNTSPLDGHQIDDWSHALSYGWCSSPLDVVVERIGVADPQVPPGLICVSYHAG